MKVRRCEERARGGFIGEFRAGRGTAETSEIWEAKRKRGIIPNSQQVCAHQGRESEVKILRGIGD